MPYDVARFTEADAIIAAYCANGMDVLPVDGQENIAYGVNYPAALITIFGGSDPAGKLPVDVFSLDENTQYTAEVLYKLGYGLSYKQPEPEEEPSQPEENSESESPSNPDSSSKEASSENSSNPGTGAGGSVAVIALLAGVAVTTKKKRA